MNPENTDNHKRGKFGEGALDALVDGDIRKAFHSLVEDVQDTFHQTVTTPAKQYVETGKKCVDTVKKQIRSYVADETVKHVVDEGKDIAKRHKSTIGLVCLYAAVACLIFRRR